MHGMVVKEPGVLQEISKFLQYFKVSIICVILLFIGSFILHVLMNFNYYFDSI